MEGETMLTSKQFHPGGFAGELKIVSSDGSDHGQLHVRVMFPDDVQSVAHHVPEDEQEALLLHSLSSSDSKEPRQARDTTVTIIGE